MTSLAIDTSKHWLNSGVGPEPVPRSTLFSLEPIGSGTMRVESLSSYLQRLAELHCVTVHTLVTKIVEPALGRQWLLARDGADQRPPSINGVGPIADKLTRTVSNLTCHEDLESLTLTRWTRVLQPRGLTRANKAWCSVCLATWRSSVRPIYEPLIWSLAPVKACFTHKIRLREQCANCGRTSPILSARARSGVCTACGGWLGSIDVQPEPATNQELQTTEMVAEIVAHSIRLQGKPEITFVHQNLLSATRFVADGNSARFARWLGVPKNSLHMWLKAGTRPSIDLLLKVCTQLGVSLQDFLTSDISCHLTGPRLICQPATAKQPRNHARPVVEDEIPKSALALTKEIRTVTLRHLSTVVGHSPRTLRKHLPNLCHGLNAERRRTIDARQQGRRELLLREVVRGVDVATAAGFHPSYRRVMTQVSATSRIEAWKVWREIAHPCQTG